MKVLVWAAALSLTLAPLAARAELEVTKLPGPPLKRTYVPLGGQATGVLIEPVTPDPVKSHIAVIVVHPGHGNMINQFVSEGLPKYGYRVLAIAYNGPDRNFYDLLAPLAAGVKALRAMPGVDKVVLSGNSTGGAEITAYEDVAENGPAACQRPERIYKCTTAQASNLPRADGLMLLDGNSGTPEGNMDWNPAVDPNNPRSYNPALDLFAPQNGYNPTTGEAHYSPEFLKRFFAAQAALVDRHIDEAQARLDKIEKGEGEYRQNEPFIPCCRGVFASEVKPELAYIDLLSQTHAPHMLLKADGTRPVQIITEVRYPESSTAAARAGLGESPDLAAVKRPANTPHTYPGPDINTVRSFLADAVRLGPDYRWTKDNVYGVEWHDSPESSPGSIEGIHIPTLVMAGTCAVHITWLEITYDHSPAKDKEYVAVEGAQHEFEPCKPEYAGSFKHAFDYVDAWLSKPGRL